MAGLAGPSGMPERVYAASPEVTDSGNRKDVDQFFLKDGSEDFRRVNPNLPHSFHAQINTRPVMTDATQETVNGAEIHVTSAAELMSALAGATGGETILLAPGNYGELRLNSNLHPFARFASEVTIKSADPDNMAVFDEVQLNWVENLTFDSIMFDYHYAGVEPLYHQPFDTVGGSHITFRNSIFDGDFADGYGTGIGLVIGSTSQVTVENNEFFNWWKAASFGGNDAVQILNNDIHSLRSDGLNFAGQMTNLLIEGNYIHDFARHPVDHADMIQFWTGKATYASTNIVIRGNILDSGSDAGTQSIFMTNEAMHYENVVIEDNVIHNAHTHGITVAETIGLVIRNNTVLHNEDSGDIIPKVNVNAASQDVTIAGNILLEAITRFPDGWLVDGNLVVQRTQPDGDNYVGDLFVNAMAGSKATLDGLKALPSHLIEQLGVGAFLTRFDSTPAEPTGFILSASSGGLGLQTHALDASNVFGPTGAIDMTGAEVIWDFGDGTTGTGITASNTWQKAGTYDVSAVATLSGGETVKFGKTIEIQTPLALNANFDASAEDLSDTPNAVFVGDAVTFEGTAEDSAVRLNGSIVSYQRSPELVNNAEYTLLSDFKKDPGGELSAGYLISFSGSFSVYIKANELVVSVSTDKGGATLIARDIGINDSDWHRVALTFSGEDGAAIVYLDGAEVGRISGLDGAIQVGSASHALRLGDPSGGSFPGLIDNFQFWKGAMSAAQIEALAVRAEDGKFVPLEGTTTATVGDTTTDPVDDTTTVPVDDTTTVPVDDTTTVPVDDTTTDPVDDTTTVPVDDTTTDPVDDTTTVPVDEATTEWDFADVERTLVGTDGDDNLVGSKGDDVIEGRAGNDTLRGGNGNDILIGGDGDDQLFAGHGNDILVGGAGDDLLSGKFGDDILIGGMGSDTLEGGPGADLFVFNSAAESPVGAGRDKILDFSQGEDKIDLSRLAVAGKADGAFTLIGTASFSKVAGELRQFDDANGIVVEGDVDGDGAADFQIALHTPGLTLTPEDFVGLSATALALASIEPSLIEGTTTLDATEEVTHLGTPLDDHLIGTDGADVMDGREGNDTLRGKAGNDRLYGGDGDDKLYGGQGDDLLVGGAGNDVLNGGNGDDVLIGGLGQDSLTGGSGADTFVFETTFDSLPGADNRDTIEDFSRQEGDKIDLSAIDANVNTATNDSFVFIEKANFSGSAGELRYFVNSQGHAVVDGDTDGDAESDFQFVVANTSLLTLDDFTL